MAQGTVLEKKKGVQGFSCKAIGHADVASLVVALKKQGVEIHRTAQERLASADFRLHKAGDDISLNFSSREQLGFKKRPESLLIVRDEIVAMRRSLASEQDVEAFASYQSSPGEQVFLMTSNKKVFALDCGMPGSMSKPTLYYLDLQAGCDGGCMYADQGPKSS